MKNIFAHKRNIILIIALILGIAGFFLLSTLLKTSDVIENFEKYRARDWAYYANRGDVDAQYNYGECYFNGFGLERDYEQAVHWFTKAAEQEHIIAQFRLGWCYFDGYGVEQNIEQGFFWTIKSAEQGYVEAQFWLGASYYYGNIPDVYDYEQAVYWLEKAAEQGYEPAITRLKRIREVN